ncbi:Phosphatidylinositide phosphatase SAC2 [Dermatophagoides pteronyssinus]|uniref:Phosphatidylinositide phosphatase SAC2 n=1 Tax=Dermatophagoides pteronyssinus TaxID=6956 RepID=A0ABQ8JC56_DERPT|nr:Phosphatidylinositide phosphatase SAC2 [Dermatophagoides pteronyssinus]
MRFEVLISEKFVVLKNGTSTLWWPRSLPSEQQSNKSNSETNYSLETKSLQIRPEFKIIDQNDDTIFEDFTCHGLAFGLIGLFNNDKLILIKQTISIGRLPFGSRDEVFKIQKISIISLNGKKGENSIDIGLDECCHDSCTKPMIVTPTNQPSIQASFKDSIIDESSIKFNPALFAQNSQTLISASSVQRTWNQLKITASNVKPKVSSMITNANNQQLNRIEEKEKLDRRLTEEVYKMFNETNSFYFSLTGDLTNSIQRQQKIRKTFETNQDPNDIRIVPLWKRVDDRFFWNKHMLEPIIEIMNNDNDGQRKCFSHLWILPIIQGFIQIEKCCFDLSENFPVGCMPSIINSNINQNDDPSDKKIVDSFFETHDYYWMALISRRSRFRAGTRYKKRGLDESGTCANYVETEQIFSYGFHTVSFVCVRGSVPLFWSQPGYKYRPPPLMERSESENQEAFRKHFEQEFTCYENQVVAVNLIEHSGREKVLCDAYMNHVIKMDDPRLTFVTFDFHDYCRGMKFENVSILIERIYDLIKEMRYCWIDNDGVICEQRGVFRINCVDCLDRTNIVMTAIAKAVMDIQLVRLGLLPPEGQLSANSRRVFQLMWARNGDTISRQYAGTAALKSDYTRTGERKFSGVVRDGVNSANRYYLNRFKDAYRQAVIDIMQGNPVDENLLSPNEKSPRKSLGSNNLLMNNDQEYHERIKMVIEDCKKILVPEDEVILGGWPLVDADPTTGTLLSTLRINNEIPECEMDIVLILTKDCYYVADYDDQTDRIIKYQKVLLEDLEKIEIGAEPNYTNGPFSSMRTQNCPLISYAVRFHYTIGNQTGYFHMFRSTNTRFFNNMAIPIRTREEALESLKAVCESFKVALSVKSLNVPFLEVGRLERRKSKRILSASFKTETNDNVNRMKNSSNDNSYVVNSKKIFTGVYSHFSRLRGKLTGNSNGPQNVVGNRSTLQIDGLKVRENDQFRKSSEELDIDESDDEDSMSNLRKRQNSGERTLSLDLSECSEFGSEQILPPISEICSPSLDDALIHTKDCMDRVLESCGILATSPPLRYTPSESSLIQDEYGSSDENNRLKSVLHDVDDFVIDSMKKASLRHIRNKARSQSQVSLIQSSSSSTIMDAQNIQKNVYNNNNKDFDLSSGHQSNRCIFNSDLALNSIMSQPTLKIEMANNKFSNSSDSINVTTDGGGIFSLPNNNIIDYPLISSSSFAALSYPDDNDFKSLGNESISTKLYESYLEKNQNTSSSMRNVENFVDNSNTTTTTTMSGFCKETSLSFSDLAFNVSNSGLKTSRSSNTLQVSSETFMSLNLPPTNSVSNISVSDDNDSIHHHQHHYSDTSSSNFTSSLGVKKDFVLSPLTSITKGIPNKLEKQFRQAIDMTQIDVSQQQQQQQPTIIIFIYKPITS